MSFFAELKRRNVIKVAIAYTVLGWLAAQVAEFATENFGAPEWALKTFVVFLILGLPFALIFAWAFEVTPDGIKRETDVDRSRSITSRTSRKLDFTIIGVLAISLGYFVWESRFETDKRLPSEAYSQNNSQATLQPASETDSPNAGNETKSVGVLPFINMSSDPEQEYFSDGITEEIINALVKIPGLSVPARTSVFGFKGHHGDVRNIGEQLGVTHVLEGSIRTQGNQVRITAQLIKVDDGFHLWSETFDRQLDNIFVVQEEIATAIATVLTGELGLGVVTVPNQTRNMKAYDLYLKGRTLLRIRDKQAVSVLEEATSADPDFASAWAVLSIAYQVDLEQDKAIQTAEKALQLDPDNVEAMDAMASAFRDQMLWIKAEEIYQQALALDPLSSELLEDYAEFLLYTGRTVEALEVTTRGLAIDPNMMPLAIAHIESLLSNGSLDEAMTLASNLITAFPGKPWVQYTMLATSLSQAEATLNKKLIEQLLVPEKSHSSIAAILANPADQRAVGQLKTWYSEKVIQMRASKKEFNLIRPLLAWVGESDYLLDNTLATTSLEEWSWIPLFKSVRQNTRFEEYLETTRLIQYWDATSWPQWCWRNDDNKVECK